MSRVDNSQTFTNPSQPEDTFEKDEKFLILQGPSLLGKLSKKQKNDGAKILLNI